MTHEPPTRLAPKKTGAAPHSDAPAPSIDLRRLLTGAPFRFALVVVATLLVGLTAAALLPAQMAGAAALTVFCIGLWASAAVPEYWTALVFFLAAVVFQIVPPETAFSGFHSSTFWLLFGGLVLGAASRHTGLDRRAATALSGVIGTRYRGMIFSVIFFGLALGFVLPSAIGRIVLLVPIIIALADRMGYAPGSNGHTGMVAAAAFGTHAPTFTILPANAPNMILAGMSETLYDRQVIYFEYLLLHFPVLGLLKAVIIGFLILRMFPDRDPVAPPPSVADAPPITFREKHLMGVVAVALALWLTDGVHHVSPGWVALGVAIYCLWPRSNLTSPRCLSDDINYGTLFFVCGVIGLGAMISVTGLGESVVQALTRHVAFAEGQPTWNVALLTGLSTLVAIVTNLPGVPAVMTPIAADLATLTGLPLMTVLMTQVLAFSNFLLPYQAPPLITAMQVGRLPAGPVAKLCLMLFAITSLVLIPLDLLWWRLLGMM